MGSEETRKRNKGERRIVRRRRRGKGKKRRRKKEYIERKMETREERKLYTRNYYTLGDRFFFFFFIFQLFLLIVVRKIQIHGFVRDKFYFRSVRMRRKSRPDLFLKDFRRIFLLFTRCYATTEFKNIPFDLEPPLFPPKLSSSRFLEKR